MDNQDGVVSDGEKNSATSDVAKTNTDSWINSGFDDLVNHLSDAKLTSTFDEIMEDLESDDSATSVTTALNRLDLPYLSSDDIIPTLHHVEAPFVAEGLGETPFAAETPFVGNKESLSSLEDEYRSNNPIFLEKIKMLGGQYAAIRRTLGDGNCFYRSFMFSYLDHISETRDRAEVDRIKTSLERSRDTLLCLGYAEHTFKDQFDTFIELVERIMRLKDTSTSHDELVHGSQDPFVSNAVVVCLRIVTAGEMRKRSEFFMPFIYDVNETMEQFCKTSVLAMGVESDQMHIIALSDALGVPVRVVYLDQTHSSDGANHHDFIPKVAAGGGSSSEEAVAPFITLLYRPGHYDILCPKQ